MKNAFALAAAAVLAFSLSACNESASEDAKDIRASQGAVAKDNAAIKKYESELERDRAQKAAAKARDDKATQASESLEIGANKAMIKAKEGERYIDQKILEQDKKNLNR